MTQNIYSRIHISTQRNMSLSVHPYHLVDVSPWPILMAFAILLLA
jgi:hypothetical protein